MELRDILGPPLKWWWLIAAATLIAGITSYLAVSQQPPIYEAKSTLMLGTAINDPNPTSNDFRLSQELAETYINLAKRSTVRNAVQEQLGLSWLPEYDVQDIRNTQLLEIVVSDTSPERAQAVANELANQLILKTPTSQTITEEVERREFVNEQLKLLQANIEETSEQLLAKEEELASLFGAREIAAAEDEISSLDRKLRDLQYNYGDLLSSTSEGARNTLSIVENATLPLDPVGPEKTMTIVAAVAVGFALAAAAAYLLDYVDDTVKTPTDVLKATQLPTLAGIADFKTNGKMENSLITKLQPRSPISEDYRNLRTAILFANIDDDINTVMVTSPSPGEGKSVTAANLAIVMAQAGQRVLLIDADMRRPVQHKIFELGRNQRGLSTLLVQSNLDNPHVPFPTETFYETFQPGLTLLTSGPLPPNPAEIVGSHKLEVALQRLSQQFDYIVIDSPPVLAVTDALVLSTRTDGVLVVARSTHTRRGQLQQTVQRLKEVKANLLGVTLNRLSPKRGTNYYYYYHYGSEYHHENEEQRKGRPSRLRRRRKDANSEALTDALASSSGEFPS